MSDTRRGVVVGHRSVAVSLIDAAEQITGMRGALTAVSNTGCDRGALEARVAEAVGPGRAMLLVDLPAGSCLISVLRRLRDRQDAEVVTCVNLAMLVDFLFHTDLALA